WRIAWDGDQIAGLAISRVNSSDKPDQAWVSVLGVSRPWRKRGLGYALLRQSFALFQSSGFKTAALAVDGSSLTNAVALYERAGMHVHQQRLVFRKMIRGSEDDLQSVGTNMSEPFLTRPDVAYQESFLAGLREFRASDSHLDWNDD